MVNILNLSVYVSSSTFTFFFLTNFFFFHENDSGTIQGDVHILNSRNMKVQTVVKKAHLGLVTALAFSSDSRFILYFNH